MIASLAFRNVLRNKERSLLTLVGVVLAIGSFVALVSLAAGFTQRVERELGSRDVHIYVIGDRASSLPASPLAGNGGAGPLLPRELETRLQVTGVRTVTPVIRSGLDSRRTVIPVLVMPLEHIRYVFRGAQSRPAAESLEPKKLEISPAAASEQAPNSAPSPRATPSRVGPPVQLDAAPDEPAVRPVYPLVVGVGLDREVDEAALGGGLVVEEMLFYKGALIQGAGFLNYTAIAPLESFLEQRPNRGVHEYWLTLDTERDAERIQATVEQAVQEYLKEQGEDSSYTGTRRIRVLTRRQYTSSAREYLGYGWALQVAVAMVGVLIAVTASMNTMLMSTYERLGEYATLRAVGASRRVIAMTIIYEATFLNVTGGLLGLFFGYLATGVLDHAVAILLEIPYPMAGVTPALLLQALGLSFAVGLSGSVIPIFIVSRIDLVAQLRKGM